MSNRKIHYSILSVLLSMFIIGVFISSEYIKNDEDKYTPVSTNLIVEYIDVGQGDSILITTNNHNMLIDAGNNKDGSLLVNYFKEKNIDTFEYVVGTHPHEDHIGGLDDIVKNFNINTIYMPNVSTELKSYTDLIDAINQKEMKVTTPSIGDTFSLGEAELKIIYLDDDPEYINGDSIIIKLTFGRHSFLFTGDATKYAEEQMLSSDIKADVLKIAHHGSPNSNTLAFINKVKPKYAIISVGENNDYNFPSDIILNRLKVQKIETHRTDKEGTIVVESDGEKLTITSKKTNTNRE